MPWPKDEPSLRSRERVEVAVRASGASGWTAWSEEGVEAALLDVKDWEAKCITTDIVPPATLAKRPFYVRHIFNLDSAKMSSLGESARVYATALGVYYLYLNGKPIGDHILAPGWQTYNHRLHYQTYEIPSSLFRSGENVLAAVVGEGWYAGRLTWAPDLRNIWGEEIGVQIQLEAGQQTIATGAKGWEWAYGPLLASELYDGEVFDVSLVDLDWCGANNRLAWRPVKTIPLPSTAALIAPEAPPIRRIKDVKPVELLTSPKGKSILDFGQNLVGWPKVAHLPAKSPASSRMQMRFAEVLDHGEIGMRPLRTAKATDVVFLGSKGVDAWEPTFTTHGFRYVEVEGCEVKLDDWVAVVVCSDMERLGDFECSHEMISHLHRNVVWGLQGNFVGLPTDCPQRDER